MLNLGSTPALRTIRGHLPTERQFVFARLAGVGERECRQFHFLFLIFFLLSLILSGIPKVIQTACACTHIKPSFDRLSSNTNSLLHSYSSTFYEMDYFLRPLWSIFIALRSIFFPSTYAIETTKTLNFSGLVSLDSTPATGQAGDKEKAPTYFIMPDLVGDCPFPLGRHPNADELTADSTKWLVGGCPELSPKRKQALWGLQVRDFPFDF